MLANMVGYSTPTGTSLVRGGAGVAISRQIWASFVLSPKALSSAWDFPPIFKRIFALRSKDRKVFRVAPPGGVSQIVNGVP